MDANPLTSSEIEAFARLSGVTFMPFEFELICALDDRVRAIGAKKTSSAPNEVPAEDGAGVSAMMRGLGAKPRKARAAK
jgi:hypothetical protein